MSTKPLKLSPKNLKAIKSLNETEKKKVAIALIGLAKKLRGKQGLSLHLLATAFFGCF